MPDIDICHRHHFSEPDEAVELVKQTAVRLQRHIDFEYTWRDRILHLKRTGARGEVIVDHERVRIKIWLGFMLRPLKSRIIHIIEGELAQHLSSL